MKYFARIGDRDYVIEFEQRRDEIWVHMGDRPVRVDLASGDGDAGFFSLILNGVSYDVTAEKLNNNYHVTVQGEGYSVDVEDERTRELKSVADTRPHHQAGVVRSVMPGLITQVLVKVNDDVEMDQPLAIMEAMKMENEVRSPLAGKVTKVAVQSGESVGGGQELFVIE